MKIDKACMIFIVLGSILFLSGNAFSQGSEDCIECSDCDLFESWRSMCTFTYQLCIIQGLPSGYCDGQRSQCERDIDDLIVECTALCTDDCDEPGTCPDGTCVSGENCPLDAASCEDNMCYEPTCTDGCGESAVVSGSTDESCNANTGCTNPPCSCAGNGNCIESEGSACHTHTNPDWLETNDYDIQVIEKGCTGPCGTEYLIELKEEDNPHCGERVWVWLEPHFKNIDVDKCYRVVLNTRQSESCGYIITGSGNEKNCPVCDNQMPVCSNSACESPNTDLPCQCGSAEATSDAPWCCAADIATFPERQDCISSPSCAGECLIDISFSKDSFCPDDSIIMTIEFLENGEHVDYTTISAILRKPRNEIIDLLNYLTKVGTGIYEVRGGIGTAGMRTLEVDARFGDCEAEASESYIVYPSDSVQCRDGEEPECSISTTYDKEYYCEWDDIEITTEFTNNGVLEDPTYIGAMIEKPSEIIDITGDYERTSTGVYVASNIVGTEGTRLLYLSANFGNGCQAQETSSFFVYSGDECPDEEPPQPPEPPESPTCTDSDSTTQHPTGMNYYVEGVARGYTAPGSQQNQEIIEDSCMLAQPGKTDGYGNIEYKSSSDSITSECIGEDCKLIEGYCRSIDNALSNTIVVCPGGCYNGACLDHTQGQDCIDTDNGKNIFKKGVVYYKQNGQVIGNVDSCRLGSGSSGVYYATASGGVMEYTCSGGISKTEYVQCPDGCNDGACIKEGESKPDLTVADIYYSGPYYIKAEYCNLGPVSGTDDFLIKFRNEENGEAFPGNSNYRFSIPASGQCAVTGGLTCGLIDVSCGDEVSVSATIDWEQRVEESDETNNMLIKTIGIEDAAKPDLTFASLQFDPSNPKEGERIQITAIWKNLGAVAAPVDYSINSRITKSDGSIFSDVTFIGQQPIDPGATRTFTHVLNKPFTESGQYALTLTVDSGNTVHESDETNNIITERFTVSSSSCYADSECNDSNPCTEDQCMNGICAHGIKHGTSCGQGRICRNGACTEEAVCYPFEITKDTTTGIITGKADKSLVIIPSEDMNVEGVEIYIHENPSGLEVELLAAESVDPIRQGKTLKENSNDGYNRVPFTTPIQLKSGTKYTLKFREEPYNSVNFLYDNEEPSEITGGTTENTKYILRLYSSECETKKYDLRVTDISWEPPNPTADYTGQISVKATVQNIGSEKVEHVIARGYINGHYTSGTDYYQLESGESQTRVILSSMINDYWFKVGSNPISVVVDPYQKIDESDETNNEKTETITVTQCDSGEYYKYRKCYSNAKCTDDPSDDACCEDADNCVFNGVCYDAHTTADTNGDGVKNAYCYNSGYNKWYGCSWGEASCEEWCGYHWVSGGESAPFGGYSTGKATSCCGDEPNENYISSGIRSACCDSPNDIVDANGNCLEPTCDTASDCDDGNPCTEDQCMNGKCAHGIKHGTSCGQGKICNNGVCIEEETPLPDLTVTDITRTPENPNVGDLVTFTAKIKNIGTVDVEKTFHLSYSTAGGSGGSPLFSLKAGETEDWINGVRYNSPGEYTFTVTVDNNNNIDESDETNNEKTETLTISEPCQITFARISPECDAGNTDYCETGEHINFEVSHIGSCPSDSDLYVQIDAQSTDRTCNIEFIGGDIQGIHSGQSGLSGSWVIPYIPENCDGKTLTPIAVGLYEGGDPRTGTWIAGSNDVSGSFTFAADPTCTDSDGGKDYYKKGEVQICYASGLCTSPSYDECTYCTGARPGAVSCGAVIERYCDNDKINSETKVCPAGCKDGACINEEPKPDLTITDISWTPLDPRTGESVVFKVTVKNNGTKTISAQSISTKLGIPAIVYEKIKSITESIPPGNTLIYDFSLNPATFSSAGTYDVIAKIDYYNSISESDENNNDRTENINIRTWDCNDWNCDTALGYCGIDIADMYDTNDNHIIDVAEFQKSASDVSKGIITGNQFCGLVNLYDKKCVLPEPCQITLARIFPECYAGNADYCETGERIDFEVSYTGNCEFSDYTYVQIDAKSTDNQCMIEYETGLNKGDMKGINSDVPGLRGSWIIPEIPDKCKGKEFVPVAAGLYVGGPPGRGKWYTGTQEPQKLTGTFTLVPLCTDSDGGQNYYVMGEGKGLFSIYKTKGRVQGEDANKCSYRIDNTLDYSLAYDCCDNIGDMSYVWETYCSDGILMPDLHECPIGCKDGVCIECKDSDDGKNYYVRGTITFVDTSTEKIITQMDTCHPTEPNTVREFICKSGYIAVENYLCPNGCEDGACIQ